MNERILELAQQAGITTNLETDFFEKDPNAWVDYFAEKFAELIVKECAKVLTQHGAYFSGDGEPYHYAAHLIEEYFGVEECL